MKVHETRFLNIIILSLLIFTMTSVLCSAQEWSRTEKSEIYGICRIMDGGDSTISYVPSEEEMEIEIKVNVHDTTVYGIGLGYNLTEKYNLNTDFLFGSVDTTGTQRQAQEGAPEVKSSPGLFVWDVNLDYSFWTRRFSPLLTGGIGALYFTGDDYDEADFSYNLGIGFRWDARDYLFVKAVYRFMWTKMHNHDTRILFDGLSLGIGYMY